jgi:hypothetical protein
LKEAQRFRGPCCLHLQDQRGSQAGHQQKLVASSVAFQPRRQCSSGSNWFILGEKLLFSFMECWRGFGSLKERKKTLLSEDKPDTSS